jgi:hypothetical protein
MQEVTMVVCPACGHIIYYQRNADPGRIPDKIPDDWSFVRLRTTGEYQNEKFIVCGRIRLQLRNDYKNFWCAEYKNGKSLWIVESHASFSVFSGAWMSYEKDPIKLRANLSIPVNSMLTVKGEYVEKCEEMSFEGELSSWKHFDPGFFVVQGSHSNGPTAIFTILNKHTVDYLLGEKVKIESLNLQNIHEWNEWK